MLKNDPVLFSKVFLLYFLALFFMGLCYLAIMPVFEGYDETAYYSSIRELAATRHIPIYGASFLDQEVTNYQGPMPYSVNEAGLDKKKTYADFFTRPSLMAQYTLAYDREPAVPSSFMPSREANWQAQHPPLYYLMLAPVERGLEGYSLVSRIFVLRLLSFLMALVGVACGMLAIKRSDATSEKKPSFMGFLLYPIIFPMFFPEFARVGSDSLCLCLMGISALLLSESLRNEDNKKLPVILGGVLGIGLLTKAFFVPVIVALGGFLAVRLFTLKDNQTRQLAQENIVCIFLPAVLIGGGWYAYKFISYGSFIGGDDAIRLANQGGVIAGLKQHFSFSSLIKGFTALFVSYSWAGTWSMTRLPPVLHLPLLVLMVWGALSFVIKIKQSHPTHSNWLVLWLFVIFGLGLLDHMVIGIALDGNAQTPGYYLHILMPWIAPALGVGFWPLMQKPRVRLFIISLLVYAVLFQITALWAQFTLFTGCSIKGNNQIYAFSDHNFCLGQTLALMHRLSLLAWPNLAPISFGCCLICILSIITICRNHQTQTP